MQSRHVFPALFLAAATLCGFGSAPADAGVLGIDLADAPAERAAAVSGVAPVLDDVQDMTVQAGETADQSLAALDVDGEPLSFQKVSGPSFMTVSTVDAGSGLATGNIHLAPGSSTGGTATGEVSVSDGQFTDQQTFQITVSPANSAPVLNQPVNMTVAVGETADQAITATDVDGDPLTFSKIIGPAGMTVTTTDPGAGSATGNIHVEAQFPDVGSNQCWIRVSDGALTDQNTFVLLVIAPTEPYLFTPNPMTVGAGLTADQTLYAYDSGQDALTFYKVTGPAFMTVTTTTPMLDFYGYGNLRLAPSAADIGSTSGVVGVTDGVLSDEEFVAITVVPGNQPPTLSQPADMAAAGGELVQQTITASDPDGDYIYLSKVSGPSYMTVSGSGYGTATGVIAIAPGASDIGTATGTVRATAGGLSDTKSFTITVVTGDFPPPCPVGSFSPVTTDFGDGLFEAKPADLNGDGKLDLVLLLIAEGRAATALGNGDGTFGPPANFSTSSGIGGAAIGDFNGDEIPDVAVLDYYVGARVFPGDGTGGFGAPQTLVLPSAWGIAAADVNRDGRLDLAVGSYSATPGVSVFRGNGDGTFQAPTATALQSGGSGLALADLNRDGAPDLLISGYYVSSVGYVLETLLNNGSGHFAPTTGYPTSGYSTFVTSSDLNRDGDPDIVLTVTYPHSVAVWLGNGDGTLGARRDFNTGDYPAQAAIADLNGDDIADLAVSNYYSNNVSVHLGDGSGAFGLRTNFSAGGEPWGVAAGDFNDDLRADFVVANYGSGSATVFLNTCAPPRDHPPVVRGPKTASGDEGAPISFEVTADDPDGPIITGLVASFAALPLSHNATFVTDAIYSLGTFAWTPTFQDGRTQPYEVVFTATNVLSGSWTTKITVRNVNRGPVADPGGPYTVSAGTPLTLDGTGSSDPDGDALTYSWVFGDGSVGVGSNPVHTYAALGTYGVALSVSDGVASNLATTTATVVGVFQARVFTSSGNRSIRLNSGKPQWCANLEPVGQAYPNVAVDLSSLVMRSTGTGSVSEIHAIAGKTSIGGDHDGNGVEEIAACFAKQDLRLLFSYLHGNTTVPVTIEGRLFSGGILRAQLDVNVIASGGPLAASLSPNPLNPDAVLTFATGKPGFARIDVFDLSGRRVRQLLNEQVLPAGYHDVRVNARGDGGEPLASGVYFFRIDAVEGVETGRFTILK